jgi:hypothetical protein
MVEDQRRRAIVTTQWTKQGLIFVPEGQAPWVGTHAALPVGADLTDRHRVFLSSRDEHGRSHIGYIDLSRDNSRELIDVGRTAVVSPGPLGSFDDAGVTSSCVVAKGDRLWLFYTGWSLGVSVPFYLNVGLATSDDGGETFRKISSAPILDRNTVDPYLTASPWVLATQESWRMWYVSGTGWTPTSGKPRHQYHIKYAESVDGVEWKREGVVCIDYASPDEHAFSRPCVIQNEGRYCMWYSYRGDRYRIGYAESLDGITWIRKDAESGIAPSECGWDSEMIAYPCVEHRHGTYQMLYNGNGYGRTGVGLATRA